MPTISLWVAITFKTAFLYVFFLCVCEGVGVVAAQMFAYVVIVNLDLPVR